MPTKLPPVMLLGDTFGYPSSVSHGVTTYYLNVVPPLSREVDLTVCLLREPHPAALELERAGIKPFFLGAHRMNPFVALQVAQLAKQRGCRILHAGGMKATLVARVVARSFGRFVLGSRPRPALLPAPVRSPASHVRAPDRSRDLRVAGSGEPGGAAYYVRDDRLRIVHNGLDLERFGQFVRTHALPMRADLGIPANSRVLALIGRFYPERGKRNDPDDARDRGALPGRRSGLGR